HPRAGSRVGDSLGAGLAGAAVSAGAWEGARGGVNFGRALLQFKCGTPFFAFASALLASGARPHRFSWKRFDDVDSIAATTEVLMRLRQSSFRLLALVSITAPCSFGCASGSDAES